MSLDAPAPVPDPAPAADPLPAPEHAPAPDPVAVAAAPVSPAAEAAAPVAPPAEVPAGGKDVLAPFTEVPPAPARRRGRPPRWLLIAGAGVLAVVVAAGLIVWHPWDPPPGAPAALHATSPTATSVQLAWPASTGGNVAHYLVLRDGKQVGEIPAGQVSWTDNGLPPGALYTYTVKAQGSGGTSGPSVAARISTITPSPVGLKLVKTSWVSATLTWHPSPLGPVPTNYVIYNGTSVVDTIPGTSDTYTDGTLTPGGPFSYSVAAQWGKAESRPSAAINGTTLAPPLSGSVPVSVTVTSVPSGSTGPSSGEVKSYQWTFTPDCTETGCSIATDGLLPSDANHYTEFSGTLTGSGTSYSTTIKGQFSQCSTIKDTDTLTVHVTASKGGVNNGAWLGWTGTVVLSAPYTSVGSTSYCPASSWNFSLSGKS